MLKIYISGVAFSTTTRPACAFVVEKNEQILCMNAIVLGGTGSAYGIFNKTVSEYYALMSGFLWMMKNKCKNQQLLVQSDWQAVVLQMRGDAHPKRNTIDERWFRRTKGISRKYFRQSFYWIIKPHENMAKDLAIMASRDIAIAPGQSLCLRPDQAWPDSPEKTRDLLAEIPQPDAPYSV